MKVLSKTVRSHYRLLKSSWGINIEIEALWSVVEDYMMGVAPTPIDENISVYYGMCLENEKEHLEKGLKLVAKHFKEPTIIFINKLTYNPCDFQMEGLTAAIVQWAAESMEFIPPGFVVEFKNKRYEFDFENPISKEGLNMLVALKRGATMSFDENSELHNLLYNKGLIEDLAMVDLVTITPKGETFLDDCRIRTWGKWLDGHSENY